MYFWLNCCFKAGCNPVVFAPFNSTEDLPSVCECDKQACRGFSCVVSVLCSNLCLCVFNPGNSWRVSPTLPHLSLCGDGCLPRPITALLPFPLVFPRHLQPCQGQPLIREETHCEKQNVSSSLHLFWSVALPACLVTGQQGDQHQYLGFLGHVRSCPSSRKIMSRGGHDYMAFLRQPVQCDRRNLRKSQQYVLRC